MSGAQDFGIGQGLDPIAAALTKADVPFFVENTGGGCLVIQIDTLRGQGAEAETRPYVWVTDGSESDDPVGWMVCEYRRDENGDFADDGNGRPMVGSGDFVSWESLADGGIHEPLPTPEQAIDGILRWLADQPLATLTERLAGAYREFRGQHPAPYFVPDDEKATFFLRLIAEGIGDCPVCGGRTFTFGDGTTYHVDSGLEVCPPTTTAYRFD